MLAIRLQRTGRSGHSQFRMIVQDSRFSPVRGRIVAYVGSYDPHTKKAQLDSEKIAKYLTTGAQPSNSAARLLKKEGIKLPTWVKLDQPQSAKTRNPDKRRSTRPAEPKAPATEAVAPAAETEVPAEAPAAEPEAPAEIETPADEPAADTPAEPERAGEEIPATEPATPAE